MQAVQLCEAAIYCQFNCQQLLICACKAFQAVTSVGKLSRETGRDGRHQPGLGRVSRQGRWAGAGLDAAPGQGSGQSTAAVQSKWSYAGQNGVHRQGSGPNAVPGQGSGLTVATGQGSGLQGTQGQAEGLTGLLESALGLVKAFSETGWLIRLEGHVNDDSNFGKLLGAMKDLAALVSVG